MVTIQKTRGMKSYIKNCRHIDKETSEEIRNVFLSINRLKIIHVIKKKTGSVYFSIDNPN